MMMLRPLFALAILAASSVATAQIPNAQLQTIFPPGGEAGSEIEVEIKGDHLDETDRLVFSHDGIQAKQLVLPADRFFPERTAKNRFRVTIAGNVASGEYEVRSVGRFGMSNPRVFVVGDRPETTEALLRESQRSDEGQQASENMLPEDAYPITVNQVINGHVEPDRIDWYKLELSGGDKLMLRCRAKTIDSKMQPVIKVVDPQGHEVPNPLAAAGEYGLFALQTEQSGVYRIGVHDFVYDGSRAHFYRLTVDRAPHIAAIYPPVGRPGSNDAYQLYGWNLPGASDASGPARLETKQVKIAVPGDALQQQPLAIHGKLPPAGASMVSIPYEIDSPNGRSNSVPLGVTELEIIPESGDNDASGDAQPVTLPCEVVGQLTPRGDRDWVRFEARAGDVIYLELLSHRIGAPTDGYLLIQEITRNEQGEEQVKEIARQDEQQQLQDNPTRLPAFDVYTRDPEVRLEVARDATYRVMVRDLYGAAGGDERFVYRLAIRREAPDFQVAVTGGREANPANQNQVDIGTLNLRRGGAVAMHVRAFRRGGFRGEITLKATGLPNGVKATETILGGTIEEGGLVFEADENAAAWSGPIQVVAEATIAGKQVTRPVRHVTLQHQIAQLNTEYPRSRLVHDLTLSVMDQEQAVASVTAGDGQVVETAVGGVVELPIQIQRRDNFSSSVKLTAVGLPSQVRPPSVDVGGADGTYKLELDRNDTPTGVYTFFLSGDAKHKYNRNQDAVEAAKAESTRLEELLKNMRADEQNKNKAKAESAQAMQQADSALKQAEQQLATDEMALKQAESQLQQAEKQMQDAKAAAEQNPDDPNAANRVQQAEQQRNDAQRKLDETTDLIEQRKLETTEKQQQLTAATEASAAAEQAAEEAARLAKQAEAHKQEADKVRSEVENLNKPQDATWRLVSSPVRVRVVRCPLDINFNSAIGPIKAGETFELPIDITRKFGFDDKVTFNLVTEQGQNALNGKQFDLNKGQSQGKLEITVRKDAEPGTYQAQLRASLRFNKPQITEQYPIEIKVLAAEEEQ